MILNITKRFTETLEMVNFPLTEESDRISNFLVLDNTENVIVGGSRFLLCCQIFEQIRDRVTFGLELVGIEWYAACCLWPDAGGVVDVIRTKTRFLNLLRGQVAGQLMHDGRDNFPMGQLFRTYQLSIIAHPSETSHKTRLFQDLSA